jgi:hypothetical protein
MIGIKASLPLVLLLGVGQAKQDPNASTARAHHPVGVKLAR